MIWKKNGNTFVKYRYEAFRIYRHLSPFYNKKEESWAAKSNNLRLSKCTKIKQFDVQKQPNEELQ